VVIPRDPSLATLIEFSHRITSGVALIAVVVLLIWVWRVCGPGHPARRGAVWTVVFMLTEAAVGAGLVLFQLVADDASMARAMFMAVHLLNTFVLVAWLTLTAWWLSGGRRRAASAPAFRCVFGGRSHWRPSACCSSGSAVQ
jgi:heme a synthase